VLAVAWHSLRGKSAKSGKPESGGLVRAMLSGDKPLPPQTPASRDTRATRLLALIVLLICIGVVAWLVGLEAP